MDAPKKSEDVIVVDVHTAKDLLNSGDYKYLDVRTIDEYNKSHIDNALNVSYMFFTEQGRVKNLEFLAQVRSICKKEDRLIVACNTGGRGLRACVDLLNDGYMNVMKMEGGYSAWVDNGFAGDNSREELKSSCKFRP